MANKVTMTDRERDIASQIRGVCAQIIPDVDTINKLKDETDTLNGSLTTSKLDIMAQIAEMSSLGKWLPGEITHATAYAAKMGNTNPDDDRSAKSLSTFLSEMNAVAHPRVRDRFKVILGAVDEAWTAEDTAKKLNTDEKTPIRKWASRKYHAITQSMRAVKNGEAEIECAADVVAWAEANDPDFNPVRVASRLETMVKALQTIVKDFESAEVSRAHQYLSTVTAEELIQARKVKLAKAAKAAKEHAALQTPAQPTQPSQPTQPAKPAQEAVQAVPAKIATITPITPIAPSTPALAPVAAAPVITSREEHTPAEGVFDTLPDMSDMSDIDSTLNDIEREVQLIEKLSAAA